MLLYSLESLIHGDWAPLNLGTVRESLVIYG